MIDNNRLNVIEKLEKTSESLKAAASSMRHELLGDGVDVEKVKEALRYTDWKWLEAVCCRLAGYSGHQSSALMTEWMEVPEIQEPLKNILQYAYPSNVKGNVTLSKEFPSPKVEVYLGGGHISCRIEFADLEELQNAIYDGTVRADGLLKQLDVFAKRNETHREALAWQIQENRERQKTMEARKADIERLAQGPPNEMYESFDQKWGELAQYNSYVDKASCSPELKAKMLRKQAAYCRLQARGLDEVTERRTGRPIPDNRREILDSADRMEKEAEEIDIQEARTEKDRDDNDD